MSDNQGVTLMEVYRRLADIDTRHGDALDRIDNHLGTLNSKVAIHERLHAEGNAKMQSVERELFGARRDRDVIKKDAESGIVLNVPTDGKTIAALLIALATALAAWKAGGL